MIKRILIITVTFLIALSGFLTGFFSVGCMSVYASVNDDSVYVPLRSENDAVKAFQAYCKSRDLTIEGSLTDAVTTFTTGAFNTACNEIGIDITELQAEIKAEYDSSGKPVKFLFNDTGVMAMNRIFAQFLQDNELQEGDENVNKLAYSGEVVTDSQGNSCLVTVFNNENNSTSFYGNLTILYLGTEYKLSGREIYNQILDSSNTVNFVCGFPTYGTSDYVTKTLRRWQRSNETYYTYAGSTTNLIQQTLYSITNDNNSLYSEGYFTVFRNTYNGNYYIGNVNLRKTDNRLYTAYFQRIDVNQNQAQSGNVYITAIAINNNVYEGDTIINNEGDIINNYPAVPNDPNDTIHNVPQSPLTPNDDGGWDIDLPDIDIPNLPIGNLSEKFPFSIPWDLVAFYAMLDAEPEAPRFNGTMDLTLVQWNYDIDLSPFDSAAELCRKLQFGLFVVGLIVASRSIIRG